MPNIKSAIKRVKLTAKQNEKNTSMKSALRTSIKKASLAVENKDDNANVLVKEAVKKLDMAAGKNIIHKNAAAHKKSQLEKALNASK